jgi:tetratricopeptide (TPR) repeat protein
MALAQSGYEEAERDFREGRFQTCETYFKNYLAGHPSDLKTLEYLGDIRGHAKDWEGALSYYEQLRQLSPGTANYWYKCGGALGMQAKESNKFKALMMISDVRSNFEKAIKLDPNHIDARWALIELNLALPGIAGGSESKAQRYASELLRISPVDGYLARGRIAEYFGRWASAEKYYKLAVETGGSRLTYQKLADLYTKKLKQPEKARLLWAAYGEKNKS